MLGFSRCPPLRPILLASGGQKGWESMAMGGWGGCSHAVPGGSVSSVPGDSPAWTSVFELDTEAPEKTHSTQCPNEGLGNEGRYCQ